MAKSQTQLEIKKRVRREKRRRVYVLIAELLVTLLLAAACAATFFSSVIVQENSMNPTLGVGDRVFVDRLITSVRGIRRNDVIAYRSSNEIDSGIHIKRVIGRPGETVEIKDGLILINGTTYIENNDFPNITNPGLAEGGIKLGNDEYFVLGDNRNSSEDSRFADVGNINRSSVAGKVWYLASPASRSGFIR